MDDLPSVTATQQSRIALKQFDSEGRSDKKLIYKSTRKAFKVKKTARLKLAVEIIAGQEGMQEPRLTESVLKGTLIDTEIATLKHARALIAGAGKRSHRLQETQVSRCPQKQSGRCL